MKIECDEDNDNYEHDKLSENYNEMWKSDLQAFRMRVLSKKREDNHLESK